jgi:hypothetical protein
MFQRHSLIGTGSLMIPTASAFFSNSDLFTKTQSKRHLCLGKAVFIIYALKIDILIA